MPRAGMLLAARAAGNRRETRQAYRTIDRMERRRSRWRGESSQPAPPSPAAAAPSYVVELEQLAQLRSQGVITDAEYEAKKQQILGL